MKFPSGKPSLYYCLQCLPSFSSTSKMPTKYPWILYPLHICSICSILAIDHCCVSHFPTHQCTLYQSITSTLKTHWIVLTMHASIYLLLLLLCCLIYSEWEIFFYWGFQGCLLRLVFWGGWRGEVKEKRESENILDGLVSIMVVSESFKHVPWCWEMIDILWYDEIWTIS